VPAPPIGDESRYTTLLLNTILGGGMSSRLFQTVREERGLVYAIYSDLAPYRDTGSLCVYAGTSADRALQVIDLIMEEFRRLKTEPLQPRELRRAPANVLRAVLRPRRNHPARRRRHRRTGHGNGHHPLPPRPRRPHPARPPRRPPPQPQSAGLLIPRQNGGKKSIARMESRQRP